MDVIYIGRRFYHDSGTLMSSVYEKDGNMYYRTDWGKIQIELEHGGTVTIRPAMAGEVEMFKRELKSYNKDAPKILCQAKGCIGTPEDGALYCEPCLAQIAAGY